MEIRGKVVEINLDAQIAKNGGGTYPGATISYRDKDNKLQEKAFHANGLKYNAALKNGLGNLQTSDNFIAQAEKNDGGFWEWKSIAKDTSSNSSSDVKGNNKPQTMSATSTYATKEERAQTQVYIVRQSSLANALKLAEVQGNKKIDVMSIINDAKWFENWVLNGEKNDAVIKKDDSSLENLDNDIPF